MVEPEVVVALAEELFAQHLPGRGWTFGFDGAKRRAGACDWARRRITVSRYLPKVSDEAQVRQVLLHEIAHAIAGHRAAHGPKWRTVAKRIGYTGERTLQGSIADDEATWIGTCPRGHVHYRFRRPSAQLSCAVCAPGFSKRNLIAWRHRSTIGSVPLPLDDALF